MKPKALVKLCTALCGLIVSASSAFSQGTAFTYQGQLDSAGVPVTGLFDFTNALYNASSGGAQAGPTITLTSVPVTNGLFTVILDFGAVFTGPNYWLQIAVRSNGVGGYSALSPRQELTPAPYAITAENLEGTLPTSQLTGTLGVGLFPIPLDLSGSTVPPLFEVDQNGTGPGILGVHTSAAGTGPGVEGSTASTAAAAVGVYGLVSSTSPGAFATAVRGENDGTDGNGIGVWGSQAGSGWGGYFTSVSGSGINVNSASGFAVVANGATGIYAVGSTNDGVDALSTNGIGVFGDHIASNGTAAGVQGTTASTDAFANAVYGLVLSTSPGASSAGVRGENRGTNGVGIGVWGSQAGSGWGGYFASSSGIGVNANGGTGTGILTGGGSSALTIANGPIHVTGAGVETSTAAFIHKATAANITGAATYIDNTQCNGDTNALLIVTQNWNPGGIINGIYNTHHVGVFYDPLAAQWAIFNEDQTAMVVSSAYNVLVIKN